MNQQHTPFRLAAFAAALLCLATATSATTQRRPRGGAPARPGAPAPARRAEPAPEARRAEPERPFEELLPAEGYGVIAEVRRVGSVFELGELKTAFAAARLADADLLELGLLNDFVLANAEVLADARLLIAGLSARPGLPLVLVGLQLASPEAAAAFEPKYRAFLNEGARSLGLAAPEPPAGARGRGSARGRSRTRAAAPRVFVRRSGNWLLASDKQFAPARLRAEGGPSLAESQRFQSLRGRFASEQLFVYFDISRTQEAWALMSQQQMEEAEARAHAGLPPAVAGDAGVSAEPDAAATPAAAAEGPRAVVVMRPGQEIEVTAPPATFEGGGQGKSDEEKAEEERAMTPEQEQAIAQMRAEVEAAAKEGDAGRPTPPTEEQMAVTRMDRLMRNLWGGVPRIPNAAALAVGLEGGSVALRVAVENPGGGPVNLIPFLPNVISGAPTTADAALVAPADGGIFVSTSLDWTRIFDALLGTAKDTSDQARAAAITTVTEEGGRRHLRAEEAAADPSAEESLAQVEKFFGFKLREDFLPTLGSEVAISLPLDDFTRSFRLNHKPAGEQKDAEPGFVALIELNDPEKAARLLPRVLTMLGMSPVGGAAEIAAERREGFEIRNARGLAYGVINNYLVIGQLEHVRHVADEAAAHRTLASTPGYRETTAWQAKQKLAQAYVSEGLMRHTIEESKRQAAGSTDPVVHALLAQLEAPPEGASLATTTDGDLVVHELRLPLNLVKVFGASAMIGIKEAPVIGQEMTAAFALSNIRNAQTMYRGKEGRERYGTIEELVADGLLDESFTKQRTDYEVELTVLGERFEATATPKQYGKTGRRSFFLDESGVIRAADHKGKPATAQDPPID